jgi:hypothetical protein
MEAISPIIKCGRLDISIYARAEPELAISLRAESREC